MIHYIMHIIHLVFTSLFSIKWNAKKHGHLASVIGDLLFFVKVS